MPRVVISDGIPYCKPKIAKDFFDLIAYGADSCHQQLSVSNLEPN
jgi:hypothetical protein